MLANATSGPSIEGARQLCLWQSRVIRPARPHTCGPQEFDPSEGPPNSCGAQRDSAYSWGSANATSVLPAAMSTCWRPSSMYVIEAAPQMDDPVG